jgi:hypothetical protein
MRRQIGSMLVLLGAISAATAGRARADVDLRFDLGPATISGSTATLDVSLTFTGSSAVSIESLALDVQESSPQLTGAGSDFSRFAFQLDAAAWPGFTELVPLSQAGLNLIADDPGQSLTLSPGTLHLGTLSVDLTGLAAVSGLSVSLAGLPPFGTDAGGTIDGVAVLSFAAAGPGTALVEYGQPDGVVLAAATPEPGGLVRLLGAAVCLLGYTVLRGGREGGSPPRRTTPGPCDTAGHSGPGR